jgi:hypothetical protein
MVQSASPEFKPQYWGGGGAQMKKKKEGVLFHLAPTVLLHPVNHLLITYDA